MALIKIQGKTKFLDKTFIDGGYKVSDSDAAAYIANVESADGQTLEDPVKQAIDTFVIGCKSDSIWSALKASCILAGARTLNGALVPLVGSSPTNNNFVSADYDRETGLVGDGSTKYLDSNRANNDDPIDSKHIYVNATSGTSVNNSSFIGTSRNYNGGQVAQTVFFRAGSNSMMRCTLNDWSEVMLGLNPTVAFGGGLTRSTSGNPSTVNYFYRNSSTTLNSSFASTYAGTGASSTSILVFKQNGLPAVDARLSFYSIGEDIDLSKLDTRVSTLMTDIAAAI